jgi:transcriptional regulator with XRE-family HTH domain
MNILKVINKHNFSTHSLAKALNIKQSSIMSVVKEGANPTVNTLRNMAAAMKMPVWEFFEDEMTVEELEALIARKKAEDQKAADQQQAVEQPKENEQSSSALTADVAFICPHCHEAIKLGFVK